MRSKILDLLREAGDSYLSGEEMAKRLGVSRTAVWKHIQELRRDGYDIVSHSRSGYSLQSAPDTLRPEEIKNGLRTRRIGREIRFYPTVDSTNLEAKRLAQQGAPDGLIVEGRALRGGTVDGCGDHRVVMSLAVLALAAGLALPISGAEAIAKSWPDFLEAIKPLGAEVEHVG